jgi:Tol biopolymer transport system component
MPLTPGTKLGPYEILSPIGAGGMGEVYKARDTRLERTVAVKVLPSHTASSPEVRQRFEREAKTISQLSHPHICALYDVGREGETEYLVMELLEGETLSERLAKGPLPLEQTLRYGTEIADALDKAHRQGIVHRDLKPGNAMITKSGVKLLDFGLAKAMAPAAKPGSLTSLPTQQGLTREGTILGTFQYMAPEQLEGKEADGRTDIFAFGAVLYEMATGRKAFSGASQASLISAIMQNDPPPISAAQRMSPPALDRVVKTCFAKNPEDRWQSAADVGKELKWIAEGSAAGVAAPLAVTSRRRRREGIAWGAAALAGLVAAGTLFLSRRPPVIPSPRMVLSILPPAGVGWTDFFALSPDGRRLAFVGSGEGRTQIWIQALDEEAARAVAGTENAEDPFWSPDGRSLAFLAQSKLRKLELESGAIQVICDADLGRGASWSREGVILFANSSSANLSRVAAAGGTPVAATRLDAARGDVIHRWPDFLPDGRRFIVFVRTTNPATTGIYLGALGSTDLKFWQRSGEAGLFMRPDRLLYARGDSLVAQHVDVGQLRFVGEPETILRLLDVAQVAGFRRLFSVSDSGVLAFRDAGYQGPILWFDRSGKVVGKTSAIAAVGNTGIALSPDDNLVAYSSGNLSNSDIWILDLKRDVASRFTFGEAANAPAFSRNGKAVYYRFLGSQQFEVRRKAVQGGAEEPVFSGRAFESPQDETPDGKTLILQNTNRSSDIWSLPLQGDGKLVPLVATSASERNPRLSPDGRWLAYGSDESGHVEVYVRRFPATDEKWQVSTRGGGWPYWRGDGKEIFYVGIDGILMAVRVSAAGEAFSVGAPEMLFQTRFRNLNMLRQYVPSADGKRFLLIHPAQDPAASPMRVLLNWRTATP